MGSPDGPAGALTRSRRGALPPRSVRELPPRPDHPANAGWTGRTGRVERVLDDIWWAQGLDSDGTVAFLCGNPAMIEAVEPALRALGMPDETIRPERYWPPT